MTQILRATTNFWSSFMSQSTKYTPAQIRSRIPSQVPHPGSRAEAWEPMGENAGSRERAEHASAPAPHDKCERGDLPVTGRLPRPPARPRNLRYLLPVATLLRGKRPLENTWSKL